MRWCRTCVPGSAEDDDAGEGRATKRRTCPGDQLLLASAVEKMNPGQRPQRGALLASRCAKSANFDESMACQCVVPRRYPRGVAE